jgi:dihydroorotate dehydrogenase electron transfer subunit
MSRVSENRILSVEELTKGIYKMTLESDYIAQEALPGQFVNIRCCGGSSTLLRRPISICSVDRAGGSYDIVFQVKGTGTGLLAAKHPGGGLDVMGPLGRPFETGLRYARIAVVGGGIGIFPLLFLLKDSRAVVKRSYLGFRSRECIVLRDEFARASSSLDIATDDGSEGCRGVVTGLLERDLAGAPLDLIYACGPTPMLKRVSEIAGDYGIPCQVSLEQRMGCGFGACLVCACRTKREDGWEYRHVCKDGPVFWSGEVDFE